MSPMADPIIVTSLIMHVYDSLILGTSDNPVLLLDVIPTPSISLTYVICFSRTNTCQMCGDPESDWEVTVPIVLIFTTRLVISPRPRNFATELEHCLSARKRRKVPCRTKLSVVVCSSPCTINIQLVHVVVDLQPCSIDTSEQQGSLDSSPTKSN
jgi:hypothetical protein